MPERGTLFHFDPDERHSFTSDDGARLLLLLAPWPGEGHYRGDRGRAVGRQRFLAARLAACASARRCQRLYAKRSIVKYVNGMKSSV